MVRLRWSRTFEKSVQKLAPRLQVASFRAVVRLTENPKHPSLNLEKLQGASGYWSIRVNAGCRIVLLLEQDDTGDVFTLVNVGSHDIYGRL